MQKKKLLLGAAAVVIVMAVLAAVYFANRPETAAGAKTVTVEVIHKDESKREFTYHTDAEYLGEVLLAEGLVEGSQGEYGLYILKADGETADYAVDGGWWGLYQNGEMTPAGADATPIADGDRFSLVYCIG